ncbi:MAG: choice-of-anchor tandem repeat GloVer-containing protein [Candidatus Korobacteraceae bacterium]
MQRAPNFHSVFLLFSLAVAPILAAQSVQHGPSTVRQDVHHDVSPPLRDLIQNARPPSLEREEAEPVLRLPLPPGLSQLAEDPIRQRTTVPRTSLVGLSFEGLGQGYYGFFVNFAPPDTNGAVGATQYVQWVNTSFAIFDKATSALLGGPTLGNTLWSGFGGGCETDNDGDVIALYDKLANRWVMSQLSVSTPPYLQCIAVSTTSDATGTWYRYSFEYTDFDDYPKMGVWPDAYYETFNLFDDQKMNFLGADACAYDRMSMLSGLPATQVCFQQDTSVFGLLPADVDGTTAPPAGSPNYMMQFDTNSLDLYQFHVDFNNPSNSTFSGPTVIDVAAFTPLCGGGTCVPQPDTSNRLDSLADRLMYRLAYRNFGSHESLVVNHSVAVSGGGGVRWYEVQNPGGTPVLAQQGTYAPDSTYRWMGSIAMDSAGDIALGYSKSSGSVYPSIAFTGRVPTDPAGTLEAETDVIDGSGSQTGTLHRWGDYSAITVDPGDDCTFWYTQEYLQSNGTFNWDTRIVNFKFPNCSPVTYTLFVSKAGTGSGTVTSSDGFINCGQVCSYIYNGNTQVTLTATPGQNSIFTGWSGCDYTNGNTCTVTMYSTRTVTATFTYNPIYYWLSVSVNGNGTVTSADGFINCPGTCSHNYLNNTQVTLNATPAQGSSFAGWTGACSGTGACNLIMTTSLSVGASFPSNTGTLTTLYSFCVQQYCQDGAEPQAGLVQGTDGNFYGTTLVGGSGLYPSGTFFRITPSGALTTLYSFCSQQYCADGSGPQPGLVQGADGNFYGTTSNAGEGPDSFGTVFKITLTGVLTTLHTFHLNDGANPQAGLVQGADGNFYGTTNGGGASLGGTVFRITPSGTLTTLYSFCSQPYCADGQQPSASLVQATDGNFYGTTSDGGYGGPSGNGTVFRITPSGTLTTLHSFKGADGAYPAAALMQANDGNFYGTTWHGGFNNVQWCSDGCGTVFTITMSGTLTTLYDFCGQNGCLDGYYPEAGLVQASDGNLYGTTSWGGGGLYTDGTIFRITPSGTLTSLYSFCSQPNCADGLGPQAGLVQGTDGSLYGTTLEGGAYRQGTVFRLSTGLVPFVEIQPTSGNTGTPVTILGTNLTGATGVAFNGTPASFQVVSPTEITTNVPAGATTGPVQVTTPGGVLFSNVPFLLPSTLTVSTSGNGAVTSTDGFINCPGTCSHLYPGNTQVTLNANPAAGWTLSSWSGACSDSGACVVTMTQNQSVGATFTQLSYTLTVAPVGSGTVTSTDGFINCPGTCSHSYLSFTQVTLNALPGQGWVFGGWDGGCLGTGSCTFTMTQSLTVDAVFSQAEQFVSVTPCRLVDTRPQYGGGGPIQGMMSETFNLPQLAQLGKNCAAFDLSSATAYSLNIAVVPQGPLGYLTMWPAGLAQPYVATLNSVDGRVKAVAAIVAGGASQAVSVYVTNTTDVIIDIDGYFTTPSQQTLQFYPLPPCRVADTRYATGFGQGLGAPYLSGGVPRVFPVLNAAQSRSPATFPVPRRPIR